MSFLSAILTPKALQVVHTQPTLLPEAVLIIVICILMMLLTWYGSYVTGKPYRKPKAEKKTEKK